jgi:hypothetical protein
MKKVITICAVLLIVSQVATAAVPFNNPNYTYTQILSAGVTPARSVWPDYSATAGKILWRDNSRNGYVADFNPATGAISNQTTFASGTVYEASFSPDGASIFYQDDTSTTSLAVAGGTIDAYKCYRYTLATGVTTTVFDISTIPAATIEALTSYVGNEFGFYLAQGGSDNELLMSVRAVTGQMEIVRYNISAKSFTNLTNSAQAEYDGQYLGTDTSKLLYWTESYPTHADRGISILSGGTETNIATTTAPDMYLGARWGANQSHVIGVQGTGFSNSDLVLFTLSGSSWSAEDLTGDAWTSANGGVSPGPSIGDSFLFGIRGNSDGANGLWYAQPIPEPVTEVWVDDDYDSGTPGWGVTHFDKIQDGINAVTGSVVHVAAGEYDEPLDIDGVTDLEIIGEDKDTTIIKSSTTLGWNVGGYGTTRLTVVRIVNSTDVSLKNLTIDCDLIKGNSRYGVFGWDSSITVDNCILKNISVLDSSGGYTEIMSYFRASGYSDESRAAVNITNCTFIDAGRVGIVTHDYLTADISGNTFYKTFDDFGYAVELGSMSNGSITGNKIYGYDIPAASDGSSAAGLYIENSFTSGITTPITKDVLLQGNEIYDCQYAMTIGNQWNGMTGNVDIVLTMQGNNFHNNVSGGIIVADEDKSAGSSVTVIGSGNTIVDNNEFAYFVYTVGDGDVAVDLSGDTLTGNQYGMYVGDYASGPSGSSYDVKVNCSDISNNSVYGIDNEIAATTVDATKNWWGDISGPGGEGAGAGSAVSANVNFFPWLLSTDCGSVTQVAPDYVVDDGWVGMPDWTMVTFDSTNYFIGLNAFDTIQKAVNAASDGNSIRVAAGTYNEAVLINKSLNIRGATADLNKNGYPVPDGYAWDDSVESIINHPNPTVAYNAVVDIYDVNDVTFEGFVVQELNAVGNLNSSLVRVYALTREITNINVKNNVIGGNTNVTAQDGKQGRMGLYIVNHPYNNKGVINSTFSGNKIFDCQGNGDNIFIWSAYFAYGAPSEASMRGTVIEDNEIYGSHRSGIESAGGFADLTIRNNKVYGNSGLPSDDPNNLKYGNGILLVRGSSDKMGGATTAYGPVNLTIRGNEIFDNEKNGIYTDPIVNGLTIVGNKIQNNGWDAVRIDLEGTYWNPTFEPAPGQWSCYDGASDIEVSFNNLSNNGAGVEVIGTPTNGLVVNATYNWWGDRSGPNDYPCGTMETDGKNCYDVSVILNADGLGNAVSEYVEYCPWLLVPIISSDSPCPAGDLDGDCDVDFKDLAILADNWLVGTEG